jgi:hypothetical protein
LCVCLCLWWVGLGDGLADGEGLLLLFTAGRDDLPGGLAGDWLAVECAGAVRANRAAKPTVTIALIWVARQVSRDMRRSPSRRARPAGSAYRAGRSGGGPMKPGGGPKPGGGVR